MSQQDIEQIELSIEEAQQLVDRKNQLEKLFSNREFKKVVLEGYFKEEAERLVRLSGDMGAKPFRDEIFLEIQAIAKFRDFLTKVGMLGRTAERDLAEARELRDELRVSEDI